MAGVTKSRVRDPAEAPSMNRALGQGIQLK